MDEPSDDKTAEALELSYRAEEKKLVALKDKLYRQMAGVTALREAVELQEAELNKVGAAIAAHARRVGPKPTRCPDCQAEPLRPHAVGCDVERCAACGMQRIGCDCSSDAQDRYPRLLWTGDWPGVSDCLRLGILLPDGEPDLNKLSILARWDPTAGRWEKL